MSLTWSQTPKTGFLVMWLNFGGQVLREYELNQEKQKRCIFDDDLEMIFQYLSIKNVVGTSLGQYIKHMQKRKRLAVVNLGQNLKL